MKYIAPLFILILSLFADKIAAQGIVSGKVYENINQLPIEGVSIRNKNTGGGELSDKFGFYSVNASAGDSIEVYILGYKRFKFKVTASASDVVKNVYLTIEKFNLPEVEVLARRNVTKDSLNNRRENAALFAYRRRSVGKAILGSFFNPVSSLQSLVDMGKNRRLKHFQAHLVAEERDNYIDSRFTRENVEEITGLKGKELEAFISSNKPSFEFTQNAKEYDMLVYIKEKFASYTAEKAKDSLGGGKGVAIPAGKTAIPTKTVLPGKAATPGNTPASTDVVPAVTISPRASVSPIAKPASKND